MPFFDVQCYETVSIYQRIEAKDAAEARAKAEADIAENSWENWQENSLGTNGVEFIQNVETGESFDGDLKKL